MPACPDDEGLLDPAWAQHLAGCEACRERRRILERDEALFAELRGVARRLEGPPAIPGYRLEGELSRGGQGVVFRAEQESTQRVVALKILSERARLSARERRRFEREVELSSRLAHPGIVTVFDSGVHEGLPWYAMELVAGETLDVFAARTAPALEARLELFLELCAAVAHAHRSGVIHRDLKPGNVLVDERGRVRVLDFGTALPARLLPALRLTAPGEFLGTLAYAAPEQVGGPEACDTRTDVYSLGVLLFEFTTGTLPIDIDGALAEVVERVLTAPPRVASELDPDLALILATTLEKERERRYPSVEALARDVRHFLAHEPLEARPRRAGYVLRKALRRHRRALVLGSSVALLALVLGGAVARERLKVRRADENAALVRAVFQDILGAAAPGRMGGDAPLRDVLALAAREIETSLAQAPDAQAAVQLTIGDTYRKLLMHAEAEGHLRLALERMRAVDGDGLETARCLELLGETLAAQGKPEAISVQEEALALRRRRLGADDPRSAASERALARALMAQVRDADLTRARELLDSALARFRAAYGDQHVEVAETQLALARLESWTRGDEAEARLASALAILEAHVYQDPRDPRLIECLTEYSSFLQVQKRYDEAEQKLARAQQLARALYGDELTSDLLRRQAMIAQDRGLNERAIELTRHALAFELRRWAANRPGEQGNDERGDIERVAAALEADGKPPFVAAFQLLRRFRGDGAFELAGWSNRLARCLESCGEPMVAEGLLREALNIRCRAWGAECPVRQGTLQHLGDLLADQGRTEEALPLLEESLTIAEVHGEPDVVSAARLALVRARAVPEERP